ncbi:MAG: 30S ribosomal protein S6 [Alphaproteobacteria bacterium]|nr:30S ribosomal protein S6 [Alphaproteobacteria bacterium]
MAFYENVFIARQDIAPQQVEALTQSFGDIVRNSGGTVGKTEYWGLRNLTFRIKKNRKGHYMLMNLDAPWPAVVELERNMRINEDIIHFQTVRVEALEEGPSAVMQSKGRDGRRERGERGHRDDDERGERREAPQQAEG